MNFFKIGNRWVSPHLARQFREYRDKKNSRFCMYCVSKANRHMKDCPTRKEGFVPEEHDEINLDGSVIKKTWI